MTDKQTSFERHQEHMTAMSLGKIIGEGLGRDAVHIAVMPIIGTDTLWPGYHVAVIDGKAVNFAEVKMHQQKNGKYLDVSPVGIVDPFLMDAVEPGQRFWLFLYPGSITSLKHVWTHPAFEDTAQQRPADTTTGGDQELSEAWIRSWCASNDCPQADCVIAFLKDGHWSDEYGECEIRLDPEYVMVRGMDAHADIPMEFWHHAEIMTGRKFRYHPAFFTCSC